MNARLAEAIQRRQRAEALAGLRKLAARPAAAPMDTTPLDEQPEALPGIPLPMIVNGGPAPTKAWFEVDGLAALNPDALAVADVGGVPLVIGNVDGTLLAYRNTCVGCGGRLDGGSLVQGALTCPGCGRSFFLPRAGRSLDDDNLQLEPVPLLRDDGVIQVALAT